MLRLSTFPFHTMKSTPNGSDNKSTGLLLQAGFIRQTMAGVYTYTTLGLRVLRKIEQIIREEMENIGCHEVSMPNLSPKELWEKTNRWNIDVLFHVPAANEKEYALNCTQEELVTPLLGEFIQSYKDLPTCVYQIQYKFRNEKRAKSGILRGREFIMKDAYSFHASDKDFIQYYEIMKQSYLKVFERLGLGDDTVVALADGGVFTEKNSHEFQVKLSIGEDEIYQDPLSKVCYNQEVAPSRVGKPNITDTFLHQKEDVEAHNIIGVKALCSFLGIAEEKTTKTMMFETDSNTFIVACVRGDYNISTLKLRKILGCKTLTLASEDRVEKETGAKIGYAGIVNLSPNIQLYLDDSLEGLTNFETGTNKTGYHSKNVNFGRDIPRPEKFHDLKETKKGDRNPESMIEYEVFSASEIGNIFPLETKFSQAFGLTFLDENNQTQVPLMGCYGLGVTRAMGIVAEYFSTHKGILWPEHIAPASHYIIVVGEEHLEYALDITKHIEATGGEVILDDRYKTGFGQRAGDADLLGIPHRIVISSKTREQGGYELKRRGSDETEIIVTL